MDNDFKKILTYPGNGVFTVNTAKEKKDLVLEKIYQTNKEENVIEKWHGSLNDIPKDQMKILGVASDCGAGIIRGSNWGPLALRESLLKKNISFFDYGDIRVVPHLLHDKYLNEKTLKEVRSALYEDRESNLPVSPLSQLEFISNKIFSKTNYNLFLGGDHSISWPLSKSFIENKNLDEVGILHFDAHTDLLDKRLGIDYCFGSWAYHASKVLKTPANIYQLGIRSSGKSKDYWEREIGVKQLWSDEIRNLGAIETSKRVIEHFKSIGVKELYLSFDIDAIDSEYVSATGTAEPNGLYPSEAIEILKTVFKEIPFLNADLVEVAPYISQDNNKLEPYNTLETATSIIETIKDLWEGK